jgi:hypothetical protein
VCDCGCVFISVSKLRFSVLLLNQWLCSLYFCTQFLSKLIFLKDNNEFATSEGQKVTGFPFTHNGGAAPTRQAATGHRKPKLLENKFDSYMILIFLNK